MWLLPSAVVAAIGLMTGVGLIVWWLVLGGRQDMEQAGKDVSHALGEVAYQAVLNGQRFGGVDTSAASRLPILLDERVVGHTRGRLFVGHRPADTSAGALGRWVQAESLLGATLGQRAGILGAAFSAQVADASKRRIGLADLLAQPTASVIYAGELVDTDSMMVAGLIAVLEPSTGATTNQALRLERAPVRRPVRGQLWLGPGPVILPLQ